MSLSPMALITSENQSTGKAMDSFPACGGRGCRAVSSGRLGCGGFCTCLEHVNSVALQKVFVCYHGSRGMSMIFSSPLATLTQGRKVDKENPRTKLYLTAPSLAWRRLRTADSARGGTYPFRRLKGQSSARSAAKNVLMAWINSAWGRVVTGTSGRERKNRRP